jgi:hypothetical protein
MATLSVQEAVFTGLAFTYASASTADVFANDGKTFLIFLNANASARTLTITGNAFSKPGFGDISAADAGETVTLPGSGTNGGRQIVGPFPQDRFNNSSGQVSYTLDVATDMTVAAIKLKGYA